MTARDIVFRDWEMTYGQKKIKTFNISKY
jgi:hypothetical protein